MLLKAPSISAKAAAKSPTLLPLAPQGPGVTVVINEGETFYLEGSYVFSALFVKGTLLCGKPGARQKPISLALYYMDVSGLFRCGRPASPYRQPVTITLRGQGFDGSKHLAVTGRLMMVGTPRVAWTKLTRTVLAGDNRFTTLKAVDWKRGEKLVVASTDLNADNTEEVEVVSVTPASGGHSLVTVKPAFRAPHWGTLQTYRTTNGAASVLDERAEVGLLSRNIVVQGDEDSGKNGMGGIVTMYNGGHAWISDVLFFRMGQKSQLGKYPVHWHLVRGRKGDYLRNTVIWKSWNRCMAVHGTNDLLVDTTVCYDHIGHGYMIEDGCEVNNMFRNNLGIRTRKPASLQEAVLDTDFTHLATYWIVNPLNHFVGNVGAASDDSVFWIMLPRDPVHYCGRQNLNPGMKPQEMTLGLFDNNVAHSSRAGLVVEGAFCDTDRAPVCAGQYEPQDLPFVSRLTAYKCWHSFRAHWIIMEKPMRFDRCVFADNGGSLLLAGKQIAQRSLVVGESQNTLTDTTPPAHMGYAMYDGPGGMINCHFAGFQQRNFQAIRVVGAAWKRWNAFIKGTTFAADIPRKNRFAAIQTVNMSQADAFDTGMVDLDGCLTGSAGTTIMLGPLPKDWGVTTRQDRSFNVPNERQCKWDSEWRVYLCKGVTWGSIRLLHDLNMAYERWPKITVSRSDGPQVTLDSADKPWYQFLAIIGRNIRYTVRYHSSRSLMWQDGRPKTFSVEFSYVDTGAKAQVTLTSLPLGWWRWYVYDCVAMKRVHWGVNTASIVLKLTAVGPATGAYPNLRNGYAKLQLCTAEPCTCYAAPKAV